MANRGFSGWEGIRRGRVRAQKDLPHILKIPVIESARDSLAGLLKPGMSILDIGANDRNLEIFLREKGLDVRYKSLDIDPSVEHDYRDLRSVNESFDAVAALEVIEHMGARDAFECFTEARRLLKKGGFFIVSTPNVCHPTVFWRDSTHITPFRYDELYGLLTEAGFDDVRIFRCGSFGLKERLLGLYYRPLLRLLRMDFMPGIAAVARAGGVAAGVAETRGRG